MSVVEVVDDLLTLQVLVERESDVRSREALAVLQRRVAGRDKGAKVSEAATILGLSGVWPTCAPGERLGWIRPFSTSCCRFGRGPAGLDQ